jgi:hypothetical protein
MMTQLLHDSDDEFDLGVFRRYLRTQSDDDLLDIADHIDTDLFPARIDAARQELAARRLPIPPSWPPEASFNRWRPEDAFVPTIGFDIPFPEYREAGGHAPG